MLDTLQVHIEDYELDSSNKLLVQPSTYEAGSGEKTFEALLWKDRGGSTVYGSKAFLNTEKLNLTVKPFPSGGVGCFAKFSVPKVHNGDNFYSVGKEGTEAVLTLVEKELSENGFHTTLREAAISRLDTFQNIQTEEPFLTYAPLFQLLEASRKQLRSYGTTFLWHNTQQELTVYDKLTEAALRGIDTSAYPENTMRFELRLLNKKKVEKIVGFSRAGELSQGWEELKRASIEQWEKSLFRYSVGEVQVMAQSQLMGILSTFESRYGSQYFSHFIKAMGALSIAEQVGIENAKQAVEKFEQVRTGDFELARKKAEQQRRSLKKFYTEIKMLTEEAAEEKTLQILYEELRGKICLN
jgi:hypothetical protein